MSLSAVLRVSCAAAIAVTLLHAPALAHDPVTRGPLDGLVNDSESKACNDKRMLNRIKKRFRHQVKHVPHLPDVEIVDFERVHEHRYFDERELRPIARRYCMATAVFDNGQRRSVWYAIENGLGFASFGDGVQFCVSGFDRWYVYDRACRVLR
jgi:hypothetical protein